MTAKDNRLFVEAVLYRYRAGIPWADLPERFEIFGSIHTRHTRWSRRGVWKRVFERLGRGSRQTNMRMIDLTIVRPTSMPPEQNYQTQEAIGRSKGPDHEDPRHLRCAGQPGTGFHPTPGQAHDLRGVDALPLALMRYHCR